MGHHGAIQYVLVLSGLWESDLSQTSGHFGHITEVVRIHYTFPNKTVLYISLFYLLELY